MTFFVGKTYFCQYFFKQIPIYNFKTGDVFILDYKKSLIQWNGKEANRFEKLKACQCLADMAARNGRQQKIIVEQGRFNFDLIECLGPMPESFHPASCDTEFEKVQASKPPKAYKIDDTTVIAEGTFKLGIKLVSLTIYKLPRLFFTY